MNFDKINEGISKGNVSLVKEGVNELLATDIKPMDIIDKGLMVAMNEVGVRFKNGDMFVPEVMMSAKALHCGLEIVKPLLSVGENISKGTILIGTVRGDLHDIGKNLVAMMIESAGFEVIDLGVDVSNDKIIECYRENPDTKIIALSALLTTTMPALRDAVDALNKSDFRSNIKVMVGGAPITQEFADEIGADGYSEDAASAATLANQLIGA